MAKFVVKHKIGIIAVDNPPVNTLGAAVRRDIYKYVKSAEANSNIQAIVIYRKGRSFPVGADISEFGTGSEMEFPSLDVVVDCLEECKKPTIAAVHGYALGGGLEIALGCHYRICLENARFGFPEVNLGILPAAGGTQRFPRLVGLDSAMEWIVFGKEKSANEAAKVGLINKVYSRSSSIVKCAVQYAETIIGNNIDEKRLSKASVKDAQSLDMLTSKYTQQLSHSARGQLSPYVCLQVTGKSAILPFADGLDKEREAIKMLLSSGQSKALRYAFFSERLVGKWSVSNKGNYKSCSPLRVGKAAVIGLGTMGSGIAISLAKLDIPVLVMEFDEKRLRKLVGVVYGIIQRIQSRGEISLEKSKSMQSSIKPCRNYIDMKDVDLVIEAVVEDIKVKQEVFENLDRYCKASTILATNTSQLDIDKIAKFTKRPSQVVGMHFFAPAHRMKLLENVRGSYTSLETIATAMDIGKRMGKVTILVGNCRGFVINRMYFHYLNESEFLLEEGSLPIEVDSTLKEYGFPMGRFEVSDISGIDVGFLVRLGRGLTQSQQAPGTSERMRNGVRYSPFVEFLYERGRYGQKTGKGWYKYENRMPSVDDEVTEMLESHRKRHNIVPRKIFPEEILQRMFYPMVNEGFKILEEGIASNPYDIDMGWIYGFSWPKHTGGPMFYAQTVGLPRVLKVIEEHWNRCGASEPHWKPSKMLVDLVKNHGNPDIMQWMDLYKNSLKSSL